jgi:hypothetical protein
VRFEQLFSAEIALAGTVCYLRHLHGITLERNYLDALELVKSKLFEINSERERKIRRKDAA